jgi:hypothetical protein
MISIPQAEHIHSVLIFKFGGAEGIRDKNALISVLQGHFKVLRGKIFIQALYKKLQH